MYLTIFSSLSFSSLFSPTSPFVFTLTTANLQNFYQHPGLLPSSSPSSSSSSSSSVASSASSSGSASSSSLISPHSLPQRAKCETALHICSRDMRCAMALQDYRTSCSHLLHNKTRTCSEVCRLALMSLNSITEGYDYVNCDCGDNEFCRKVRRRTSVCHSRFNSHHSSSSSSSSSSGSSSPHASVYGIDSVPSSSSSGTSKGKDSSSTAGNHHHHHRYKGKGSSSLSGGGGAVLCSMAEARCREDETCLETWEYVQVHCEKVFMGTECTKACNSSLNILWRQKSALYLSNCICSESSPVSSSSSSRGPYVLSLPPYSSSSSSSSPSSSSSVSSFNEISCKRRKANIKRLCFGYSSPSALSGTASGSKSLHHHHHHSLLSPINQLVIIFSTLTTIITTTTTTINLPVNWIPLSILMSFYSISLLVT